MFEDKFTKAIKLAENKKHEDAIKLCDDILKKEPKNIDVLKLKADCLRNLNKKEEALKYYNLALEIDSKRDDLILYKAEILLVDYKQFTEAYKLINMALDLNPDNAQGWFLKGGCLAVMGDIDKGINCYDVGLHLDSNDIRGWLDKGRFLKIATKHDEAIKCFDVVLSMDPKFKEAIFLKADCYLFLDELDKSFKYCNNALELAGGSSSLNINLYLLKGCLLILSNKFDEALINVDNALELDKNNYDALLMKAQCLAYKKDFKATLEVIDNSLKLYPNAKEFLELKHQISS